MNRALSHSLSPAHPTAESTAPGALVPAETAADPWVALRRHTPARIALGRAGNSLPTGEVLRLAAAQAQARDAVHRALDLPGLSVALQADGWATLVVHSRATTRGDYLRRPDLGRRLDAASAGLATAAAAAAIASSGCDLALVVGDGLSAAAAHEQAVPTLHQLRQALAGALRLSPVVLASQARVALADEIGELLQARAVLILLGERPGLSAPHSLGAYLTYGPKLGLSDAERNCVSNIHAAGLSPQVAGRRLAWLLGEALRRRLSGVALKDDSSTQLLTS